MRWYDERFWCRLVLLVIVGLLAVSLFSGCRSNCLDRKASLSRHDSETFRRDSVREMLRWDSIVKRDSFYVRDSVTTRQVGDTTYIERWHWEYIYDFFHLEKVNLEKKSVGDFSYIARSDTIRVPYPVEKELSKWEQFQLKYAIWSMGALCMVLVWLGYKLYKWIKNAKINYHNKQG